MKKQFIKNLKPGDKVSTFFVAKHKRLEYFRDKTKGKFLTILLADRSGRILARVWHNALTWAEHFEEEDIIAVWGRVEDYLGRPQIIVDKLRPVRPEDRNVHYTDDDFVPQTEKNLDELWAVVDAAAAAINNPALRTLVQAVLEDMADGLRAAPASKVRHHSYRGGLLEHIVEMLTLAQPLLTLYPRLDRDLLTAGIILHDMGLVQGTRYERDIDYSDAGRLVGHVVLGDRLVAGYIAALADFPSGLALSLSHLILSHHGQAEYGAVSEPQTLEATALHQLNSISAEVHHVVQVLDSQWDTTRAWTEFDRISNRFFFRGRVQEEAVPEAPTEPPGGGAGTPSANSESLSAGAAPDLEREGRAKASLRHGRRLGDAKPAVLQARDCHASWY